MKIIKLLKKRENTNYQIKRNERILLQILQILNYNNETL